MLKTSVMSKLRNNIRRCFACGLRVKAHSESEIILHRFPTGERKELWLKAIDKKNVTPRALICSNHFKDSDYYNESKSYSRRLRKDAVPFVTKSDQIDSHEYSKEKLYIDNELINIYSLDAQGNVIVQQHCVLYTKSDLENIKSDQSNNYSSSDYGIEEVLNPVVEANECSTKVEQNSNYSLSDSDMEEVLYFPSEIGAGSYYSEAEGTDQFHSKSALIEANDERSICDKYELESFLKFN